MHIHCRIMQQRARAERRARLALQCCLRPPSPHTLLTNEEQAHLIETEAEVRSWHARRPSRRLTPVRSHSA